MRSRMRWWAASPCLIVLGIAACSDDGAGPSAGALTQAEAEFAAEVVGDDADAQSDGLASEVAGEASFSLAALAPFGAG